MPATVPGAMIAKIAETTMADVLFIVPKRVKSLRHSAYAEDMWRRAAKIFVPERPETPLQHQAACLPSHVLRTFAEESLMSSLTLLQSLHENLAGTAQV